MLSASEAGPPKADRRRVRLLELPAALSNCSGPRLAAMIASACASWSGKVIVRVTAAISAPNQADSSAAPATEVVK
jgi:hypothetical protein